MIAMSYPSEYLQWAEERARVARGKGRVNWWLIGALAFGPAAYALAFLFLAVTGRV